VDPVLDTRSRPLRDLRISVTDRCDFRCVYCMPKEVFGRDFQFLRRSELLTFEEIARVVRIGAGLGVRKLRLTGGEPLMRRDLERLVEMLAGIDGIDDIAMTTNGSLLPRKARVLADAGLRRVTVSLDSLDDAVFGAVNDVDFPVERVLEGIAAAAEAGMPVKVNMVVKRGLNDGSVLEMAEHFRGTGHILRLIEYMDVGTTNGWQMDDVVPAAELVEAIGAEWPLEPVEPAYPGEVARRYCHDCSRARLSAEGRLYTCLFAAAGHDLRRRLRGAGGDEDVEAFLRRIWGRRADRYSELRTAETSGRPKVEMSHIGG
jgi:cyclic pyranopterin phosphate synthase